MENIREIAPIIIALIALAISALTYVRQKTFENENHLFKYRLDKYNEILQSMRETLTFFRKEIDNFYFKRESKSLKEEDVQSTLKGLENYSDKSNIDLLINSAFLSVRVVDEIQNFLDELYGADFIFNMEEEEYNETIGQLDKLEDNLYSIADTMREDLGIDRLHRKLTRRIKH